MANSSWRILTIWTIKMNLIIWAINALILVVFVLSGSTVTNFAFSSYLSKITLLETGVAFLIGGALAFSGSIFFSKTKEYVSKSEERWSIEKLKKSEKRANKYILLAVVLFIESIAASFLGV